MAASFFKTPATKTAFVQLSLTNYVATAGITWPTTWISGFNTENWTLNLTTQDASIPLITVPPGWVWMSGIQLTWVAGAPALGTTDVRMRSYSPSCASFGLWNALLRNSQLAANQPNSQSFPAFNRVSNSLEARDMSWQFNNSDANPITITVSMSITAFRVI